MPGSGPLVVASVPSGHVYVRHLRAVEPTAPEAEVVRLPDPRPPGASSVDQWWPPVMLDAAWVDEHHEDFDLMHVHFGFDGATPESLRALTGALRRHHRPLVLTVHDLRNPHHRQRHLHDAHLDILVPAATRVLTLTEGAAAEIRARWGKDATVVPHPHVVPLEWIDRARPQRPDYVVGLHCKSLRAGLDPLPVVDALARAVGELPGARLVVDIHTEVASPEAEAGDGGGVGTPRHAVAAVDHLRQLEQRGLLTLHVHDYYSDDELWTYLQSLDLSVLPYRFGTHSGWLEACHDLGTTVLLSDCGHHAEQRPCLVYPLDADGRPDAAAVVDAVHRAYADRPSWRATVAERRRERNQVSAQHASAYRSALETA